ncbi:MAG TPA: response regulator [Thermoanaerobaculia bacterium]|nr:response regulator [Thermoanaerobaculia bacterium]
MTKSDLLQRLSARVVEEDRDSTVLVVDDDSAITRLCTLVLERAGFSVETASDGRDALDRIEANRYGAILLDLQMPFMHGATLLAILGRDKPELLKRVVVMTALPDAALTDVRGGVASVLRKPMTDGDVVHAVRCCIDPTARTSDVGDRTARAQIR